MAIKQFPADAKVTHLIPRGVPIPEARRLLGNKGRSAVYEALRAGHLEGFKDGKRTLVSIASIENYNNNRLKPLKLTEPPQLVEAWKKRPGELRGRPATKKRAKLKPAPTTAA
jgi:hypothetical protein